MQPKYYLDAQTRQAYESFIRLNAWKIGQKISDASGVHRIPKWSDHKSSDKERWGLHWRRAVVAAALE